MKKLIVIACLFISVTSVAQNMFGKNPYKNQQEMDKQRVHWGYFLGFNTYNYKINYTEGYQIKNNGQEIQVNTTGGFNVGFITNLRLTEYLSLRFEPGLYYGKKTLFFPQLAEGNNLSKIRTINSTYINFPLLLKFSAMRTGNIRPFVLGGFSQSLNLGSNQDSKDDNYAGKFRVKKWSSNYELGLGIDFYFEHFKFTPSVRGSFGIGDELVRDRNAQSPWTGGIESMKTRAILVNFTFQ
ncbi:PorT family protein [Paenimyroides tangerinum]|uniref:PorT family protein n=1 Tax=Paenimyroides tangerinum TaxID=2488728 RepID=A0A3P3W6G4_9FLAO|nr:porin family protein [Paenimyroides tangerinum]RRJ89897.1 PorT family protein [Paenimyroides tangerinum]